MIGVLVQVMRFGVGSAAGLLTAVMLAAKAAMKGTRVAARLIVGPVVLAVLASSPALAETETRILILNATDPYLPAYQLIDAAMRETLAKDTTRHFAYLSETLDAQRFDWKQYEAEFLALLVRKYKGLSIDVIVPVTQPALNFVIDHGQQLWPGPDRVPRYLGART